MHQKAMRNAFDSHFNTTHYDWTAKQNNPSEINSDILLLAANFKPDIIFMQLQTPDIISVETASKLAEKSIVVNWTGDVRSPIPLWYKQIGAVIDITLFTNLNDVNEFIKDRLNAGFLPIGYDPEINFIVKDSPIQYPIVFCGSNYTSVNPFPLSVAREEMALKLKQMYNNKFYIFGSGWNNIDSTARFATVYEEAKIYQSALIGISYSHFDYDRYWSDRLIKMMGCGLFCLSHKYTGIEKDFEIGKHLDVFNNNLELIEKIDYYLNNNEKRQEIAQNGYELASTTHTWDAVMPQLKKLLS